MKEIKLLIMDVDGTLTDGKIYVTEDGEFMKAFNVKDGYGIKHLLPKHNIIPAIITGRKSKIIEKRCKELDIHYLYQNISNKKEKMHELLKQLNINISEVAYIGDDINDIDCMKEVGISACPNNSHDEVKNIVSYLCHNDSSNAAVREFIDYLIEL